jgi:Family of unknown function (DUF5677)
MLPRETEVREEYLQPHYADDFATMTAVLDLALRMTQPPIRIMKARGLHRQAIDTSFGVFVKTCKQYRSIQLLCQHGLPEDAQALTRNLGETTIALYFLLRHRVELKQNGRRVPAIPGKPLSTKFRSDLFLAYGVLQKQKMLNEWGTTKGLKAAYKKVLKGEFPASVAAAKALLGPDWLKRQKDSKYYAGVPFRDLVLSFRVPLIYAVLFRMGSQFVHPSDLTSFLRINEDGTTVFLLQPSDIYLKETMLTANMLLVLSMDVLNARLGLGHDDAIAAMKRRIGLTM